MTRAIPTNEIITIERSVRDSEGVLGPLIEKLHQNKHVLSIETARNGGYIMITVKYAVMDLALIASNIGTNIESEFPKG